MNKTAIAFTLLLLLAAGARAQGVVVLDDATTGVMPGTRMEYLEDHDRTLDIRGVTAGPASARFRPLPDPVPNFGHTHSAIWLRFELENRATRTERWLVEVDFSMIDQIDFFLPGGDGSYRLLRGGESAGPSEGELAYLKPVFPITLKSGKRETYYLRYQDDGAVVCPIVVWKPRSFYSSAARLWGLLGLQYGIIIVMIFYNLFLFFTVRDRGYLYYILFVVCTSFILVTKDGLVFMHLLSGPAPLLTPWVLNRLLGLVPAAGMLLFVQFTRLFLDTRVNAPRIDFVLRTMMYILAVTGPLFFLVNYVVIGIILNLELVASMLSIVLAALICLSRGIRSSRFFTAALMAFLAGIFLYMLKNLGVIPSNLLTEYSIQIGNSLQLIILSLALGDRINIERREKLRAQENALKYEKEAREALKEADRIKDEFLANTSHELRTPLNGIIGIAESLVYGAAGELPGEAREDLSLIVNSGRRLSNLINDILDFSRLKKGEISIDRKTVDLRQTADAVLTLLRSTADSSAIGMINEIPADLSRAFGDEGRIEQILYNLVGNAIKFTERGKIVIFARESRAGNDARKSLEVSVSDTGIGIPRDMHETIFRSFEQVDGTISRSYRGTGLGLSITRRLVELHGGTISVESAPGAGSTFMFTLPAANDDDLRQAAEGRTGTADRDDALTAVFNSRFRETPRYSESRGTAGKAGGPVVSRDDLSGIRVLAVDDDIVNLRVIRNFLSTSGIIVDTALSAADAMSSLSEGPVPDIVLLDVMMPVMNGLELCREIRKRYSINELPVMFLTARNQIADLVEGFGAGGNDYLGKPFSKNELIMRIRTQVGLRRAAHDREKFTLLRRELDIARKIQESIIPRGIPRFTGIEAAVRYHFYEEVGGDFFDFLRMDDARFGIFIADVSGHGIPAALISAMMKISLASQAAYADDPARVIRGIHEHMAEKLGGQFVTAGYAYLDMESRTMKYASAGHMTAYHWKGTGGPMHRYGATGGMLSTLTSPACGVRMARLDSGDRIAMYTDGLIEKRDGSQKFFDEEMLVELLQQNRNAAPDAAAGNVMKHVSEWGGTDEKFDDDAMIIVLDVL